MKHEASCLENDTHLDLQFDLLLIYALCCYEFNTGKKHYQATHILSTYELCKNDHNARFLQIPFLSISS